jgi:hypothetical protein
LASGDPAEPAQPGRGNVRYVLVAPTLAQMFGPYTVDAKSVTVLDTTDFTQLTTARRSTLTITGMAPTAVAFAVIGHVINTTNTVGTSGHVGGALFLAEDTTLGAVTMYGSESRVNAHSTVVGASHAYVGATLRAYYTGTALSNGVLVAGAEGYVAITQNDGVTPLANGNAAAFFAQPVVGGAARFAFFGYDPIVSARDPFGYANGVGAGSTTLQLTSKATGVQLDRATGEITLNNANLAAGAIVSFVLTDNKISATDLLIINHVSVGTFGAYLFNARCSAGSATIDVRNVSAGTLGEAIVIRFAVIKGATS